MSCLEHGSDKGHVTRLVVVDPVAYDKLTHETMSGSRHEGENSSQMSASEHIEDVRLTLTLCFKIAD